MPFSSTKKVHVLLQKGTFWVLEKKLGGGGASAPPPPPRFRRPCLGFIIEVDGCGWVANLCVIETPTPGPLIQQTGWETVSVHIVFRSEFRINLSWRIWVSFWPWLTVRSYYLLATNSHDDDNDDDDDDDDYEEDHDNEDEDDNDGDDDHHHHHHRHHHHHHHHHYHAVDSEDHGEEKWKSGNVVGIGWYSRRVTNFSQWLTLEF